MYEYYENEYDHDNDHDNNQENNNLRKISSGIGGVQNFLVSIKPIFFSVIFALIIMYFVKGNTFDFGLEGWLMALLLLLLIFIIIRSVRSPKWGAVPFATNPLPPHLGLDGVSNTTQHSY